MLHALMCICTKDDVDPWALNTNQMSFDVCFIIRIHNAFQRWFQQSLKLTFESFWQLFAFKFLSSNSLSFFFYLVFMSYKFANVLSCSMPIDTANVLRNGVSLTFNMSLSCSFIHAAFSFNLITKMVPTESVSSYFALKRIEQFDWWWIIIIVC